MSATSEPFFRTSGHCPICDQDVEFVAADPWFRDSFVCSACGSIPRERAVMAVIDSFLPNWREVVIHESSPVNRGATGRIVSECSQYIPSQYFPDHSPGSMVGATRCENLESLAFPDKSIDLHITQDVFEHLFHPARAFKELARTLAPGGMHIFTVPLVNKNRPSQRRAYMDDKGNLVHLEPESYHGNPVGDGKSLVTVDWGFDICRHIFEASGLFTQIVHIDDLSRGIRAEYNEVLVTSKPTRAQLESRVS